MFSKQIAPLVCLRNEVWTMRNQEHVLTGRGLARRPLSAQRVHVKMTSSALLFIYTLRSIYTICHTVQTEMCADLKSARRGTKNISQCSQSEHLCTENLFREHFPGYMYREHIWTGPVCVLSLHVVITGPLLLYMFDHTYFSPLTENKPQICNKPPLWIRAIMFVTVFFIILLDDLFIAQFFVSKLHWLTPKQRNINSLFDWGRQESRVE